MSGKISAIPLLQRFVPQAGRHRIVVGMSGGIDSSVAALLLLRQGLQVEGVFMKNWEEDDRPGSCAAAADLADARRVCALLGIALREVNFSDAYWDRVFEDFLREHRAGRTPNPDILCNREIKFGAFLEYALAGGAECIATGHYAAIGQAPEGRTLLVPKDCEKDQTYFLYTLGEQQLARTLFPLAGLRKSEVRALARQAGLPNHAKRDSTGICFVGERKLRSFLSRYLSPQPGDIESCEGETLGRHEGLFYYTLGQRQGLGIGGRRGAGGAPWYVVDKDLRRNTLVVAQGRDHPLLFRRGLTAERLCWVRGEAPRLPLSCEAKIRYRQRPERCLVQPAEEGGVRVQFDRPQRAITPGQSVVFYAGPQCLGGGVITATHVRLTGC